MSLLDAFLLEPYRDPREVWLAIRSDGQRGSGTVDDPWDSGLVQGPTVPVLSIEPLGDRQFQVTTDGVHGLVENDRVTIAGVRGSTDPNDHDRLWRYWNGNFVISDVTATTFRFTMPFDTLGTPQGGDGEENTLACFRCLARFDEIVANLPPYTTVHLGPGVFCTKGYAANVPGSWQPKAGQRFLGSGREVTTVKIVNATAADALPYVAFGNDYNQFADYFEAADLTVDCNLPGQPVMAGEHFPPLACAAIALNGSHMRVRRVRAMNFGTLVPHARPDVVECFVITLAGAFPNVGDKSDCVIEDCVIERPALNNTYTTTCLSVVGSDGIRTHMKGGAVRNCLINCEYRQNEVQVVGITFTQGGVATVTTRTPHGRAVGDWFVLSGALVNGEPDNPFNGSFEVTARGDPPETVLKYVLPIGPAPKFENLPAAVPAGDMWIGRAPSHKVPIKKIVVEVGTPKNIATVTAWQPHYRLPAKNGVPQNNAWLDGVKVGEEMISGLNGSFPVQAVPSPKEFTFETTASAQTLENLTAIVGAHFQAIGVGGTTGAFIEGNRILNNYIGVYTDQGSSRDLTIRNNHMSNVMEGIVLGTNATDPAVEGSCLTHGGEDGKTAFFNCIEPHGLRTGDSVTVQGAVMPSWTGNPYNRQNVQITRLSETRFSYPLASEPQLNAAGSPVFGNVLTADSLTHDGVIATFTCSDDHGFSATEPVVIFGALVGGDTFNPFNGVFQVLDVLSNRIFRYRMNATPVSEPDSNPPDPPKCAQQQSTPLVHDGLMATFHTVVRHGLPVGQAIRVTDALLKDPATGFYTNENPYNGFFEIVYQTPTSLSYALRQEPSGNPAGLAAPAARWQTWNLLIEDNVIELVRGNQPPGVSPQGVRLYGTIIAPYVFRWVAIRRNTVRHVDDIMDTTGAALGINLYGCEQALAEDNVVRVSRANPIQYEQCGRVNTFENQTPTGQLRRGYNQRTGRLNDDLVDRIEDVWVL